MRYKAKTVESAKTHVRWGKTIRDEFQKQEVLFPCRVSEDNCTVLRVLLCLLCCGQQHKQTDEAVLQGAEVLRREERVSVRKSNHYRHKTMHKENNHPSPQTYEKGPTAVLPPEAPVYAGVVGLRCMK